MKNNDGKESNTIKRVNVGIKFNEFKDTLTKKSSDTKWKEFKTKNIKLKHMKSTKYDCMFLSCHLRISE